MLRGNIRVVCRARPSAEQSVLTFPLPGAITVFPPDRAIKDFEFNACLGPESSQVGYISGVQVSDSSMLLCFLHAA